MTRLERAVKMDFSQQQESYPTISGRDGLRARYQGRRIDVCDAYLDRELNVDGETMTRFKRAAKKDFSQQQESYPTHPVEMVSKRATGAAASTSVTPMLVPGVHHAKFDPRTAQLRWRDMTVAFNIANYYPEHNINTVT